MTARICVTCGLSYDDVLDFANCPHRHAMTPDNSMLAKRENMPAEFPEPLNIMDAVIGHLYYEMLDRSEWLNDNQKERWLQCREFIVDNAIGHLVPKLPG